MILVTLGTQIQQFDRLLKLIDKAVDGKIIDDEIIVQAGHTKYSSKNMKIFDFVPINQLDELVSEASVLITHGGVGSITSGIKRGKKVIAFPRLVKYGEHVNDHQTQIVSEFAKSGYLLEANEDNFEQVLTAVDKFTPVKFDDKINQLVSTVDTCIISL